MRTAISSSALLVAVGLGCGPPELAREYVSIDARKVAYAVHGSGSPTVVFEAALGESLDTWGPVFPQVSRRTRSFAYDRAGYGGSAHSTAERNAANEVAELRATLQAADIAPPYVLAAHSWGGVLALLFARQHPDEVVGLVLIDARPVDMTAECAARGLTDCGPPDSEVKRWPAHQRGEYETQDATYAAVKAAPPLRKDLPLPVLVGTRAS